MIREWLAERKLRKNLADCNFQMARDLVVKQFAGAVIPNDLAKMLSSFTSNPGVETAIQLIAYDPQFVSIFALARKGGITEHVFYREKSE